MRRTRPGILGAGLIAALLAVTGCGMSPTAPAVGPEAAPERPATGMASRPAPASDLATADRERLLAPPASGGPLEISRVVKLHGKLGGVISLAGVTLVVPKDAYPGMATITLTLPDPSRPECRIAISPPDKARLRKDLLLTFDAASAPEVRGMTIFAYDPSVRRWEPVPSEVNVSGKQLLAEVQTFTAYKADTEVVRRSAW